MQTYITASILLALSLLGPVAAQMPIRLPVVQERALAETPKLPICDLVCFGDAVCVFAKDPDCKEGELCETVMKCQSGLLDGPAPVCDLKCPEGEACVFEEVQCIAAPCDPVMKCVKAELPPPPKCDLECRDGDVCVLQEVQCVTAPCDPVPACVPADADKPRECNLVCYGGAECVFEKDPDCKEGELCEDVMMCRHADGGPAPATCDLECPKGEVCAFQRVYCIAAPCDPVMKCVADPAGRPPAVAKPPAAPTCATVRCAAGTVCVDGAGAAAARCLPCPPCGAGEKCVAPEEAGGRGGRCAPVLGGRRSASGGAPAAPEESAAAPGRHAGAAGFLAAAAVAAAAAML